MAKAPSFWNPLKVGANQKPDIIGAKEEGLAAGLKPAGTDKIKRILEIIDPQNSFVLASGSLKVDGALSDMCRLIDYIYAHAEEISAILVTMDQHSPLQIFFSLWWVNRNGDHPVPYTEITEEDVQSGIWIPMLLPQWSIDYPKKLRETDQVPLRIWPEHCMAGTESSNILVDLAEAIMWIEAARQIQLIYLFKGMVPESEHYGPFRCCVSVPGKPESQLQTHTLDIISKFDIIDVAGEAEDFCLRECIKQKIGYYGDANPKAIRKIRILKDCTSLVFPDKRSEANNILDFFHGKGVQIVNSTD